jgi:hypothetical protein
MSVVIGVLPHFERRVVSEQRLDRNAPCGDPAVVVVEHVAIAVGGRAVTHHKTSYAVP